MKHETELLKVSNLFGITKKNAAYFALAELYDAKGIECTALNKMLDSMTEDELYRAFDEEMDLNPSFLR